MDTQHHRDACVLSVAHAIWHEGCASCGLVIVPARAGSRRLGPGASRPGGGCGGWAAGGGGGRPAGLRAFLEVPPLVVKPVLYLGRVERLQAELLLAWLGLGLGLGVGSSPSGRASPCLVRVRGTASITQCRGLCHIGLQPLSQRVVGLYQIGRQLPLAGFE